MKKLFNITLLVLLFLSFASCNQDKSAPRKARSAGGTSEILVVTQNSNQWDGMIGDSIRNYFMQAQYGLPQPEPIAKLAHVNVSGFSDMFKAHKCILEIVIDTTLEKAVAETAVDKWAAPQRYIKVSAPNRLAWVTLFEQQKEIYKQWFDEVERARIMSIFRPSVDNDVVNAIAEKFGFTLTVPQGFYIGKSEPDFMWIRKELERSSACILIYQTPYLDTVQFSANSLVAFRNRMLQQYVPGPSEGSYMTTETEFVPPLRTYITDFPTEYAIELRGMWKVENDFMGGPFVSYSFVNPNNGKLVTLEGYYYEPNQKKRDQMLQLESILYSMKFVEQQ